METIGEKINKCLLPQMGLYKTQKESLVRYSCMITVDERLSLVIGDISNTNTWFSMSSVIGEEESCQSNP